jgi:hypothetical protein
MIPEVMPKVNPFVKCRNVHCSFFCAGWCKRGLVVISGDGRCWSMSQKG